MMESRQKRRRWADKTFEDRAMIIVTAVISMIVLLIVFGLPRLTLMKGHRIAEQFNEYIPQDEFELIEIERVGLNYYTSIQSMTFSDLVITSDMAPRYFNRDRIEFLYDRALNQKAVTVYRFNKGTSDALYEALKPKLGDRLIRVMGEFGKEALDVLSLDEEFRLGKLRSYIPSIAIQDSATDENFLTYLEIILAELENTDYGTIGVTIELTEDREEQTTYIWRQDEHPFTMEAARAKLASYRNKEWPKNFNIRSGVYYDFDFNQF